MKKNLQKLLVVTNAMVLPVTALATTDSVEQYDKKKKEQLEEVVVYAQQNSGLSSTQKITSQEIAIDPASNGNISDYLKSDPHVRFENSDANGFQQGEIKPEDISINGAEPEQTSYYIDNINVNNDLGFSNSDLFDDSMRSMPTVGGGQAYFFDANLLSSVVVHDSDVSASLGGFSGGAVVAKTKQYNGTDSVKLRYRTTRSQWTDFHVDDDFSEAFNDAKPQVVDGTNAKYQPRFDKNFFSLSVEQGLTDNLGVVFGLSRRESKIEQQRMISADGDMANRHHTRRSDNALVNFNYTPTDNDRFELGLRYSEYREGKYYAENIDSNIYDYHNAYGTTLAYIKALDSGVLTTTLAYDRFIDKRDADATTFIMGMDWDTFATFERGGMGDSKLEQENIHAEVEYTINPFDLGATNHSISVGGLYQSTKYKFDRKDDARSYFDEAEGVPFKEVFKGKINTKYQNVALFTEDLIKVNNFEFRPGVRIERDDYLKNTNIAPRFVARWNPYDTTSLSMGLNRYYGRSFASMKLTEEILKIEQEHINSSFRYKDIKNFKTPFADEVSLGFKQQYSNLLFNARYIHRKNKERLALQTIDGQRIFTKADDYSADVYTLQVENLEAWQLGKTYWNASLGFDWTDVEAIDPGLEKNDGVYLDGKFMTYGQMKEKVNNNTEEWMVRLGLNMAIPDYNINWTNKVYIKAPVKDFVENYSFADVSDYPVYETRDYGTHVQWDTSIRYAPQLMANHSMYIKFDVLNVLNRTRKDILNDEYGQYTPGRQYWLEVGYEF